MMVSFKMTNKRIERLIVLYAVLIALLFTAGCSGFGKKPSDDLPETYVGTQGVEAWFAPDSVPANAVEGGTYDVVLLLANKGAVDVPVNDVVIAVLDQRGDFTFDKTILEGSALSELLADKATVLQGKASNGIGYVNGINLNVKANPLSAKATDQTGFLATVCTTYATKLTANVCVDASTYSFQKQRKPCDPQVPIALQSQGAPVAIKKIETLTPDLVGSAVKPKFKIYIGNVGNGIVVDRNDINSFCTKPKEGSKIFLVNVDNVELNGKRLTCNRKDDKGNEYLILSGNLANDYVICSYDGADFIKGSGTFASPLKVGLSYGYTITSDPVPVTVERKIQCTEGDEESCSINGGGTGTQKCVDGHWTVCSIDKKPPYRNI